jgi:hypothetical protein
MAIALILSVISLDQRAFAQEQPEWRLVVQLADGVYVRTGIGTVPPNSINLDNAHPTFRGVGYLGRSSPGGGSLRRILKLADGRAIVYEVVVKRIDDGRRFEVTVQPVTPTLQEATQWGIDPARVETDFLKSYAAPLAVTDGDILALDLLVEPRTGVKFVDYYLISSGSPTTIGRQDPARLSAQARQFVAEDAELSIAGYELWRNGETLHKSDTSEARGRFIWIAVPNVGRVIFTLTPPPADAGFQRTAVVSDHQIVFTLGGDQYEWLSRTRIAPGPGVYRVWMRHESAEKETHWRIGSAGEVGQRPKED